MVNQLRNSYRIALTLCCLLVLGACKDSSEQHQSEPSDLAFYAHNEEALLDIALTKPKGLTVTAHLNWWSSNCTHKSASGTENASDRRYTEVVTGDIEQERLIIPSGLITKDKCDWSLAEFSLTGKTDNSSKFNLFDIYMDRRGGDNKVDIDVKVSCDYKPKTERYRCKKVKSYADGRSTQPPHFQVKTSEYQNIDSIKIAVELVDASI